MKSERFRENEFVSRRKKNSFISFFFWQMPMLQSTRSHRIQSNCNKDSHFKWVKITFEFEAKQSRLFRFYGEHRPSRSVMFEMRTNTWQSFRICLTHSRHKSTQFKINFRKFRISFPQRIEFYLRNLINFNCFCL